MNFGPYFLYLDHASEESYDASIAGEYDEFADGFCETHVCNNNIVCTDVEDEKKLDKTLVKKYGTIMELIADDLLISLRI